MIQYVTPLDKILQEASSIQDFLEVQAPDEMQPIIQHMTELEIYLARTGKLYADANYHLNEKMNSEVMKTLKETSKAFTTASAINALVKSICKEERYAVDWTDRLNSACTHNIDACRTVISKLKEEMRLSGFGNQQR